MEHSLELQREADEQRVEDALEMLDQIFQVLGERRVINEALDSLQLSYDMRLRLLRPPEDPNGEF